jgi:bisphosphoglycerate-dependent phosphoglycerate mutase
MPLNQQIRELPLSYGQRLIMKRRHSPKSMTINIMKKIQAQPDMIISAQTNTITNYVKDLFKFGDIDYKTLKYLLPPRIPIFYLLPKIHKPNNPE